ncbi:membrane protein [Bacillus coahuilensis m2-6]|uniref:Diadenylate cyclase n=1 Tax=Bacillus coahuilensis p1.1.43 TaxID=1150625 RepID=A0A147K5J7_9BACI|nr:diadenylate cyclase CdaA [Bacillus coahuilensis]KUP04480.1 membrane protein [Bacillus coahuilensis m2-6]KUP04936.1 membrane protein [Bacillus coahuilensis p1.1.43]
MPFSEYLLDINMLTVFVAIIDILLVWYVIYKLIMLIRGTKAVQLLKGIFVILIVQGVSSLLGFHTLYWMMQETLRWGFLGVFIIFQPELRRALEQLGRGKLFSRTGGQEEEEQLQMVENLTKAVSYLAKRRIGALISIERETGMSDYIETGIPMDSTISSELLINIFIPNTPLHDGAVILQKDRIAAAACYLPLSESPFISKELGTRHRAAIGISEVTDSVTIVVSEETGAISVTRNGDLFRDLSIDDFDELLKKELLVNRQKITSSANWKWGGKKSNG